jgi:hypothetical protein
MARLTDPIRAVAALALFAATSGRPAAAGDLPSHRSRPVFMETCADIGDGFVRVPGSATCLAIGGSVEFTAITAGPVPRVAPAFSTTTLPSFALDSVTETEFGNLRAFMRISLSQSSPSNTTSMTPDYLFVSLGDKTTGMAQAGFSDSTFAFYASAVNILTLRGPAVSSSMLRYARIPEAGLGWAVSLENDPANLRESRLDPAFQTVLAPGSDAPARIPNADALVQWAWDGGTVAAAATVGQLRLANPAATLPRFAGLIGLELDLKGALDGDTIWFEVAGASADSTYLGFGSSVIGGRLAASVVDAVITPGGQAKPTLGATATAAWSHVLDDAWTLGLFGSLAAISPAHPAGIRPYVQSFREIRLGTNLAWTPVDKLTVTGEVQWVSLATRSTLVPSLSDIKPTRRAQTWLLALQVKRDF